jgi:tRNA (cmo5U34)-methyltransferase
VTDSEVGRFFDTLTDDYTDAIERCFPRYREMLWALLDYLPQDRAFKSVLELGCGTGNLSVLLHDMFPAARLHLVDISGESLEVCRSRFAVENRHVFDQQDFSDVNYADGSFDLVVSSIAIHHLDSDSKQSLFNRIHEWLTDDGVVCFADQCAGASEDIYERHITNWKSLAMEAGSSDTEWDMWMQHMAEHDHHDALGDQMQWLKQAGFTVVDCPWRYLLWSVIQARK